MKKLVYGLLALASFFAVGFGLLLILIPEQIPLVGLHRMGVFSSLFGLFVGLVMFDGFLNLLWRKDKTTPVVHQESPKERSTRPVRFFCRGCGRELWRMLNYEEFKKATLGDIIEALLCTDCELAQITRTK